MPTPEDIVRRRQQETEPAKAAIKSAALAARDARMLAKIRWLIPVVIQDQIRRGYPNLSNRLILWHGKEQAVLLLLHTVSPDERFAVGTDVTVYLLLDGTMIATPDDGQTYKVYDMTYKRSHPPRPPGYGDLMDITTQLMSYVDPKVLSKAEHKARRQWGEYPFLPRRR